MKAPPRVDTYDDGECYWGDPPPERSPRCTWWIDRIRAGWRPGKRVARLGYYCAATYYGVYIWEYLHVLSPLLNELARTDAWAVACPVCGAAAIGEYYTSANACKDEHGSNQHDSHPERVAAFEQKGKSVNDNTPDVNNDTRMIIDDPDAAQQATTDAERDTIAAAYNERLAPSEEASFILLTRDFEWPEQGGKFEALLPQPAIFQRAYRAEVHRKIINKRVPILRLVFLAREDGPMHKILFAVQTQHQAVLLTDTDNDPVRLEVVISPQGDPLMLWQLTRRIVEALDPAEAALASLNAEGPPAS